MKHISTIILACLLLAGCGDRTQAPAPRYEPPALY